MEDDAEIFFPEFCMQVPISLSRTLTLKVFHNIVTNRSFHYSRSFSLVQRCYFLLSTLGKVSFSFRSLCLGTISHFLSVEFFDLNNWPSSFPFHLSSPSRLACKLNQSIPFSTCSINYLQLDIDNCCLNKLEKFSLFFQQFPLVSSLFLENIGSYSNFDCLSLFLCTHLPHLSTLSLTSLYGLPDSIIFPQSLKQLNELIIDVEDDSLVDHDIYQFDCSNLINLTLLRLITLSNVSIFGLNNLKFLKTLEVGDVTSICELHPNIELKILKFYTVDNSILPRINSMCQHLFNCSIYLNLEINSIKSFENINSFLLCRIVTLELSVDTLLEFSNEFFPNLSNLQLSTVSSSPLILHLSFHDSLRNLVVNSPCIKDLRIKGLVNVEHLYLNSISFNDLLLILKTCLFLKSLHISKLINSKLIITPPYSCQFNTINYLTLTLTLTLNYLKQLSLTDFSCLFLFNNFPRLKVLSLNRVNGFKFSNFNRIFPSVTSLSVYYQTITDQLTSPNFMLKYLKLIRCNILIDFLPFFTQLNSLEIGNTVYERSTISLSLPFSLTFLKLNVDYFMVKNSLINLKSLLTISGSLVASKNATVEVENFIENFAVNNPKVLCNLNVVIGL
ncbi:hypothetical protein RCL1_004339 [Eukaryota sp. TZLM3-RCL]